MHPLCRKAALLAGLVLGATLRAGAWPEVQSDLAPDPEVRWGALGNGLRYAVRHNPEPKGRASLRLVVAAGSIEERDAERGLAHFIEHMAFRGTREHPHGMTADLQRLGLGFGPDTAAFTFTDHTLYLLDLPDAGDRTVREGLAVFREYAQDILFEPALIDRERDVILNERDTRNTPAARAGDANLALLWPDSLQVRRRPIGLAQGIRSFTRDQFVSFYDAWYRPERMAVVVVGDIDPDQAIRMIQSELGAIEPRGPARTDAIEEVPACAGRPDVSVFIDKGLPGAECELEHPFANPLRPDTHARRVAELRRSLAFSMLQHRAARHSKESEKGLVVPVATFGRPVPGWTLASFGASGLISNWKSLVAELEREHRSAFMYGFTAAELAIARTSYAAAYDDAVRTSATWHSDWIAGSIADAIVQGSVVATPAELQRDMAADLAAATPADCLAEYRRAWSTDSLHVFVKTNPSFTVTAQEIATALNESRAVPVSRPPEEKPLAFAYTDFGPPGAIEHSAEAVDLGVRQARFANGVRLNFKPTSFDASSLLVCVRVGSGRLSQPESEPGLDLLANAIVPLGGLGKHSVEDLQDVLAGHLLSVNFGVGSDALLFSARCEPRDLGMCLQLIAAYLTDTAYRADAMPQVKASIGNVYAALAASPSGPISLRSLRVLSGGDRRFGVATFQETDARTLGEVRAWIDPQLKGGPVEMSVVGDSTWEEVSSKVAATLGALPARAERPASEDQVLDIPLRPAKPAYVATTDSSLKQVAISWFCPVPDLSGVHMERRCRMLAGLLAERVRVSIREELGAAYGFDADFSQYDGLPNLSYFSVSTAVSPEHAKRVNELIGSQIEAVREGRFTDDEFSRVRLPTISKRDEDLRDNSYWCFTVLADCQQRPERLAAARDRKADYAAITRADTEALAKRYFDHDRWFQFVAYPRAASRPAGALPQFRSEPLFTTPPGLLKGH